MSTLIRTVKRVINDYEALRKKDVTVSNVDIKQLLDTLEAQLNEALGPSLEHIFMRPSSGSGNLSKTPTIYFFKKHGFASGKRGIYCALIFTTDPNAPNYGAVTLTLTQGTQYLKNKYGDKHEHILSTNAHWLAARLEPLAAKKLSEFDSCTRTSLMPARVFEKVYSSASALKTRRFIQDIQNLLYVFERHVMRDGDTDPIWEKLLSLSKGKGLDADVSTRRGMERKLLRKLLCRGLPPHRCVVCQHEYPIDFLVAAHIKKRSKCSFREKVDFPNVAALMCKAGCDDLYEKHYIYADHGVFKQNAHKDTTPQLESVIAGVVGNRIGNWADSRQYYEWHAAHAT